MDNSKKNNKKGSKSGPSFSNDQLGENEIDKVSAEGYKDISNKKKKK